MKLIDMHAHVYLCPENKNSFDVLKKGIEEQNMMGAKLGFLSIAIARI